MKVPADPGVEDADASARCTHGVSSSVSKSCYKNNIGPQVRRRRYALEWSQSDLATKLQLAGFDTSRSGVSKIEARLSYVDDKTMLYLSEVLRVPVQELFPARTPGNRIHEFMEKLETTRF